MTKIHEKLKKYVKNYSIIQGDLDQEPNAFWKGVLRIQQGT